MKQTWVFVPRLATLGLSLTHHAAYPWYVRMTSSRTMRLRLILFSVFLFTGCAEPDCTLELRTELEPQPLNLVPGESSNVRIKVSTCSGRNTLNVTDWRWQSSNALIAAVDSISGRITGVSAGQTSVQATSRLHGLSNIVIVIVR
jgi:hypothetical protein